MSKSSYYSYESVSMDIEALEAEIRKNPDAKINEQTFKSRALH